MIFTEEDKRNYDKATKCHICGKDGFVEGDEKKMKSEIIVTYQTDLEEQHVWCVTVTTKYRSLYL